MNPNGNYQLNGQNMNKNNHNNGAENHGNKAPQNQEKPKLKLWVKIAIVVGVLLLIGGGIAIGINKYIDSKIEKINIDLPTETKEAKTEEKETEEKNKYGFTPGTLDANGIPCICDSEDVFNILVIGNDARTKDETARSDTNILVSVNKKSGEITMASFLRDTVVTLPSGKQNRLNVAYATGGFDALKQTLKTNFNINVDYYVMFDFFSFVDVVDAVGGLDIELSSAELDVINFYLLETNEIFNRPKGTDNLPLDAGTYHLNGYQALGYARNRYSAGLGYNSGSDFVRTSRQRKVISLIVDKVKTMSPSGIDNLLNVILPKITVNMDKSLIKKHILNIPKYLSYEINGISVPQDGMWKYDHVDLGGAAPASVIQADKKACILDLYQKIYHEAPPSETQANPEGQAK